MQVKFSLGSDVTQPPKLFSFVLQYVKFPRGLKMTMLH